MTRYFEVLSRVANSTAAFAVYMLAAVYAVLVITIETVGAFTS